MSFTFGAALAGRARTARNLSAGRGFKQPPGWPVLSSFVHGIGRLLVKLCIGSRGGPNEKFAIQAIGKLCPCSSQRSSVGSSVARSAPLWLSNWSIHTRCLIKQDVT